MLRGLPLTASCYKHLEDYSVQMTQRRLEVENDIKKGHAISPHIEAIVQERTVGHARTSWKVKIVSVEADQTVIHYLVQSPNKNVSFPVIIRAGTEMGLTMQPQEMALAADGKLRWHQRCVCPCEYTIALGYPCIHAGLCLALNRLWVVNFNKGGNDLVCPNDLFWWKQAKYFHPDYDIQTALKQCSGDTMSVIPPRTVEPEGWQLYPPFTSIPRMRRKKHRIKRQRIKTAKGPQIKGNKTAGTAPTAGGDENSAAYFLAYMTDPTSASSSSSSSGVEMGQAAAAAPPKVVSDLNHCHACGQTGHNSKSCFNKQTAFVVRNTSFTAKVNRMRQLPDTVWEQLAAGGQPQLAMAEAGATLRDNIGSLPGIFESLEARVRSILQPDADNEGSDSGWETDHSEHDENMNVAQSPTRLSGKSQRAGATGAAASRSPFRTDTTSPTRSKARRLSQATDNSGAAPTAPAMPAATTSSVPSTASAVPPAGRPSAADMFRLPR